MAKKTPAVYRQNIWSSLLLSLLTFGIYGFVWKYRLIRSIRALQNNSASSIGELLCIIFVPYYALYWWFSRGREVSRLLTRKNKQTFSNGALFLVLALFGMDYLAAAIMQEDFNNIGRAADDNAALNLPAIKTGRIVVSILLTLLTGGIYGWFWQYKLAKNVKFLNNDISDPLPEVICSLFIPFYMPYWWYTRAHSIFKGFSRRGLASASKGLPLMLLAVFGGTPIALAIMQYDFNCLRTGGEPVYTEPVRFSEISERSIWKALLFSVLTFGIYELYWLYKLSKNIKAIQPGNKSSGAELAMMMFVPFYLPYWFFSRGMRVERGFKARGYNVTADGVVLLLLSVIGGNLLAAAIMQRDFNAFAGYQLRGGNLKEKDIAYKKISTGKIVKSLVLCIVTFGIYPLYWLYKTIQNTKVIQNESDTATGEFLCCLFIPMYNMYWFYTCGKTIHSVFTDCGVKSSANGITTMLLSMCGPICYAVLQDDFNYLAMVLWERKHPVLRCNRCGGNTRRLLCSECGAYSTYLYTCSMCGKQTASIPCSHCGFSPLARWFGVKHK